MASTTVDSPPPPPPPPPPRKGLRLESIGTIDLRRLSQSELYDLSLCSESAFDPRRCDDIVIPKIDRSVFNESAGSRKQTYSRLRLATRKPESSFAAGATGATVSTSTPQLRDDPERAEDSRIIGLLKDLLSAKMKGNELVPFRVECNDSVPQLPIVDELRSVVNVPNVGNSVRKRGRGRPRKNENRLALVAPEVKVVETSAEAKVDKKEAAREDVALDANVVNMDKNILNRDGNAVNLGELGNMEDPYGPELGRRTAGLAKEEELLEFLKGFNGQWASRRKKKRIIEASEFGDMLPKGWKLVLAIKRKVGRVWLFCRRYKSPSGRQFVSCKEISSYLCLIQSLLSSNKETSSTLLNNSPLRNSTEAGDRVVQENKNGETSVTDILSNNVAQATAKDINTQEVQPAEIFNCNKCTVTFDTKDDLLQHQLSSHRRKRCRFGESVTDGVIIKSGKFECQYCHKTFNERNRYNGHMGAHIRHDPKSGVASPACQLDQNEGDPLPPSGIISEFAAQELIEEDVSHTADTNAKIDDMSITVQELTEENVSHTADTNSKVDDTSITVQELTEENISHTADTNSKVEEMSITVQELTEEDVRHTADTNSKIDEMSITVQELTEEDVSHTADTNSKIVEMPITVQELIEEVVIHTVDTNSKIDEMSISLEDEPRNVLSCEEQRFGCDKSEGNLAEEHRNKQGDNKASEVSFGCENEEVITESFTLSESAKEKIYDFSISGGEGSKVPNQEAGFYDIASKNVVEVEIENLITVAEKQVKLTIHGLSSHLIGSDENPANESDKHASPGGGSIAFPTSDQFSNHANAGNVSYYYTPGSEDLKENREGGGHEVESIANNPIVESMAGFGSGDAENEVEAVTNSEKSPITNLFDSSWKLHERVAEDNRNNTDTLFAIQESGPSNYLENDLPFLPCYKQTFGLTNDMNNFCANRTNEQPELVFGINHGKQRMQERSMEYGSLVSSDQNIFQNKDNLAQQDIMFDTGLFAGQTSNNDVNAMRLNDVRKSSNNSDLMLSFGNHHENNPEMATNYMRDFSVGQTFNSEIGLSSAAGVEQKQESCILGLISHDHQACVTGNNMYKHGIWEEPGNGNNGHEKLVMGFGSSSSSHMQQPHGAHMAAAGFWRTGILADTSSSQKLQCSSFSPTFNNFPDKVENGSSSSLALNMSHGRMMRGFEEVSEPGRAEQVEFSFLNNHSLPLDGSSKSYLEMGQQRQQQQQQQQSFNNQPQPPFWLQKESLSLNLTAPNMVSNICVWCRNQFNFDPVQLGMQSTMMDSVCSTCSARLSEPFL
ncbi:uncharacterized protein LOC124945060 [Impatiens glandulifera]|uniref:uncharacterized protein LOC124945060 n=1 Tax=Impatiens glandulifera TaxID=253017 RepID=UPI001FB0F15A|nr:uncharacterized protein LOC124945060 [Impatiens glandulifera]